MTESATATTTPLTPLAALLAAGAKPPQLAEYRCVLTARELDAPETETEAILYGAAVHDLGWMRRVAVRGQDRFRWLSGMVTNTVHDLSNAAGAWNLVLNAQGKIQGDLTAWRVGDELELEISAEQYNRLIAHLEHFIIMDDVELVPLAWDSAAETAIGLTGPLVREVLGRAGISALGQAMTVRHVEWNGLELRLERNYGVLGEHYTIWTPGAGLKRLWRTLTTAGAAPVGTDTLEAFRIAEGVPLYGIDMMERDLPQETSQMRALHFHKGCYLGQEIVERIRSRGKVHRHLRSLELEGPLPAPGVELVLEGAAPAGAVTSAAEMAVRGRKRIFALGMLREEAEQKENLTYGSGAGAGTARILKGPPTF